MSELGVEPPTTDQARWSLVMSWARDIDAGLVSPIDGARRIWRDGWQQLGRPQELTVFVGLADQWEDDPARRETYEKEMRKAARALLATRP